MDVSLIFFPNELSFVHETAVVQLSCINKGICCLRTLTRVYARAGDILLDEGLRCEAARWNHYWPVAGPEAAPQQYHFDRCAYTGWSKKTDTLVFTASSTP